MNQTSIQCYKFSESYSCFFSASCFTIGCTDSVETPAVLSNSVTFNRRFVRSYDEFFKSLLKKCLTFSMDIIFSCIFYMILKACLYYSGDSNCFYYLSILSFLRLKCQTCI